MYGMVNKALRGFIIDGFGQAAWEKVRTRAGVGMDTFVSMQAYPDEVTYGLASAATVILGISMQEALEGFGEYWVTYTAKEGYGDMLNLCGSSLQEFLQNLDFLHSRIALSFPSLKPPSFQCFDVTDHGMRLRYHTERPGLAPMVIGLIRGLGKRFGTLVKVVQVLKKGTESDFDEFLIEYESCRSRLP